MGTGMLGPSDNDEYSPVSLRLNLEGEDVYDRIEYAAASNDDDDGGVDGDGVGDTVDSGGRSAASLHHKVGVPYFIRLFRHG